MYNVEEVGARSKGLREDKGISQYEMADAYSNYFNVSVEYIMYGTDENKKMDGELQQLMMMLGNVPYELRNAIETMLVMYKKMMRF